MSQTRELGNAQISLNLTGNEWNQLRNSRDRRTIGRARSRYQSDNKADRRHNQKAIRVTKRFNLPKEVPLQQKSRSRSESRLRAAKKVSKPEIVSIPSIQVHKDVKTSGAATLFVLGRITFCSRGYHQSVFSDVTTVR
jgi:hypothetical protein